MSWHYLPELVGESSEPTCLDGEQSVQWRKSRIAGRCSSEGSVTACFPCSQYGTTATPSTGVLGLESWMSSLRDSRASLLVLPANKVLETTSATDGLQPFASLARSGHGSSYWRTFQGCLALGMDTLDEYSQAWPRSGMMQSGTASQLRPSAPLMRGTGSGSLPTPTALQRPNEGNMRLMRKQVKAGKITRDEAAMIVGKDVFLAQGNLKAEMWRTPTAHNAKEGGYPSEHERNTPTLGAQVGGKLNPPWVAWLMAWPIGWTDLRPLAMDKWQAWCRSHGINSETRQASDGPA